MLPGIEHLLVIIQPFEEIGKMYRDPDTQLVPRVGEVNVGLNNGDTTQP